MNADHYYEIGSSHFSCEDYAVSGNFGDVYYAVIADGCSASEDSEVGSRIIAHAAKDAIRLYHTALFLYAKDSDEFKTVHARFRQHIILTLKLLQGQLSLNQKALDSTLLIALSTGTKSIAFVYGDGNVLFTLEDGARGSSSIDFDNVPYYLSYWMDPLRREGYLTAFHEEELRVTIANDGDDVETYDILDFDYDKCCFEFGSAMHSISVASDGLETYQQKQEDFTLKDVPLGEVINQVGAYKNFKGEFVKRRMNSLKKKCLKSNTTHDDDVSIATIFINPIVEAKDES